MIQLVMVRYGLNGIGLVWLWLCEYSQIDLMIVLIIDDSRMIGRMFLSLYYVFSVVSSLKLLCFMFFLLVSCLNSYYIDYSDRQLVSVLSRVGLVGMYRLLLVVIRFSYISGRVNWFGSSWVCRLMFDRVIRKQVSMIVLKFCQLKLNCQMLVIISSVVSVFISGYWIEIGVW